MPRLPLGGRAAWCMVLVALLGGCAPVPRAATIANGASASASASALASGSAAKAGRTTATAPRTTGDITILHTNDLHGQLSEIAVDTGDATAQTGDHGRPYQEYPRAGIIGGFARVATAVERLRAERGAANVLLVDAGDTFGDGLLANLTRGAATLRMMDALGYQFMALGNHDFEYGANQTRTLQSFVRFPMRAANALVRGTGVPFNGDPTRVVVVSGVRVGLLALAYHNTDQTGNKDNTRDLEFVGGIETARRWVPALRARADVIVVVSHQGTLVDSVLAAQVPGIDVIVGGHSHDRLQPPRRVGNTWLAQALSDATALGELRVRVVNERVSSVVGVVHELYADRVKAHPRYVALLDSIRAPFHDTLHAVVAMAAERIGRQYKSESPVDRLAAGLLREWANAEVAFLPGLGFGVTLQPGAITRELLIGLFPHPTAVVHMQLTGAQIQAILEQSATNLRPALAMDRVGGLIQSSGIRYTIDLTKPVGSRIRQVSIGSAPLNPARDYRVVTTGGLLQGTHRQSTFAQGAGIRRDSQQVAAVLEAQLRALHIVRAPIMGTVILVQ